MYAVFVCVKKSGALRLFAVSVAGRRLHPAERRVERRALVVKTAAESP